MPLTKWRLDEWNAVYSPDAGEDVPMTTEEIREAIKFLRNHNYPKPEDCPEEKCPKFRPACKLGVCNIAVGMCGDF